ncbi:hypothetical protein FA370_29260, partial [Pseudomonas aeruginosa]|nr:hypothetical protein [Pseudomonas aeruginosa]
GQLAPQAEIVFQQDIAAERLESWLALGGRGDQACPCGSGKRYRNCCSRLVASAS